MTVSIWYLCFTSSVECKRGRRQSSRCIFAGIVATLLSPWRAVGILATGLRGTMLLPDAAVRATPESGSRADCQARHRAGRVVNALTRRPPRSPRRALAFSALAFVAIVVLAASWIDLGTTALRAIEARTEPA